MEQQLSFAEAEYAGKKKATRRDKFLSEMNQMVPRERLLEHPFHIVKDRFKFRKVRYRGLRKNMAQIEVVFALANLVIAKKRLLGSS